jgi:hypothetical protein
MWFSFELFSRIPVLFQQFWCCLQTTSVDYLSQTRQKGLR